MVISGLNAEIEDHLKRSLMSRITLLIAEINYATQLARRDISHVIILPLVQKYFTITAIQIMFRPSYDALRPQELIIVI